MQASDYKQTMINRVNYLAKEEQKFLKKIQKTRLEADKRALIKDQKIKFLQEKLDNEKREANLLKSRAERGRS